MQQGKLFILAAVLCLPSLSSAQVDTLAGPWPVGLADLLVDYLPANETSGGPVVKTVITTPEGWWRKRPSVERRARTLLGETPPLTGELDPRTTGEVRREGYRELAVSFNSGSGDEIFGWLLVPDGAAAGLPASAILALHSTIEAGAKVTVGIERARPNRDYGQELARRGYVVLAIDEITAGRRVYGQDYFDTGEFDRRFPRWSAMGKMLHDHRRAIDFLATRAEVDTSRIGVIGHSLGGYNAFFHQAFDTRVKAAVSSCGFVAVGSSASPFRFARASWFVHFPALRDYLRSGIVPCDMHEVLSLSAPRPFFNYSARQDHIFPDFWAVSAPLEQVARVYEILGAADRFVRVYRDGDHDFPPEVRQQAYEFLDRWMKK